ncbi:hypothetical protein HZS_7056 [Henneguya salminicola]|nr:hypothetical protein HZS_7056 [Henneguya salminicola]
MDIIEFIKLKTPRRLLITSDNYYLGRMGILSRLSVRNIYTINNSVTFTDCIAVWASLRYPPLDIHSFISFQYIPQICLNDYANVPSIFYRAVYLFSMTPVILQIYCNNCPNLIDWYLFYAYILSNSNHMADLMKSILHPNFISFLLIDFIVF